MAEFARRTARVLLIDAADRLLLMRSALVPGQPERGHEWFTPGGGVEDGEDLTSAAARELAEETGLKVTTAELRLVAYTSGHADLGWANGLFRDDFFLCRVTSHEVDTAELTDFERTHYSGYRWWTHGELTGTSETIYPNGLAVLVGELLSGPLPQAPVALPWQ